MKRILLISCLIFCSTINQAQIPVREMPSKKEISKTPKYDSTCFWYYPFYNKDIIKQYIGQKLYILPPSKNGRFYYPYFEILPKSKKNRVDFQIPAESFANQSLTILDAYMVDSQVDWTLKLLYKERDTIYYVCEDYKADFNSMPFILQAFYEKSKTVYKNKLFVNNSDLSSKDANTGDVISFKKGETWECIDIAVVDNDTEHNRSKQIFYHPMLVFKNSNGNEIYVNFVKYYLMIDILSSAYPNAEAANINDFSTLRDYKITEKQKLDAEKNRLNKIENQKKEIIQKFGQDYGNLINNNKVAIGMTKEMCQLSLGNPLYRSEIITENGKYEVWNYGFNTFLYFENSVLKMIKK